MSAHRKKIYRSLQKQSTGIRRAVSASTFFDASDIHSFRTRVKKIRAFLHWLGTDKKTLPGPFKKMYHLSGELRDIQVLLRSMEEKNENHPAFTTWLRDNAGRLQQLWDDIYHPQMIRSLENKLQHPPLKKPSAGRLQSFFNKGVDRIEAVVYLPAPDDDELHEMRKRLKDMYYVCLWGKKHDYTPSGDPTPEHLKKLGEACGEFNDRRIALLLLDAYVWQEQDPTARGQAEELRQRWEEDRRTQKRALLQTLRDFVATY